MLQQQGAQLLQDEFGAIPDQNWEMQEVEHPNDQAVPPRIERQNVQAQNNHVEPPAAEEPPAVPDQRRRLQEAPHQDRRGGNQNIIGQQPGGGYQGAVQGQRQPQNAPSTFYNIQGQVQQPVWNTGPVGYGVAQRGAHQHHRDVQQHYQAPA